MNPVPIPGWPVVVQAEPTTGGRADGGDRYEVRINHGPLITTIAAASIDEACALVSAALAEAADWRYSCLQSHIELALGHAGLLDQDSK